MFGSPGIWISYVYVGCLVLAIFVALTSLRAVQGKPTPASTLLCATTDTANTISVFIPNQVNAGECISTVFHASRCPSRITVITSITHKQNYMQHCFASNKTPEDSRIYWTIEGEIIEDLQNGERFTLRLGEGVHLLPAWDDIIINQLRLAESESVKKVVLSAWVETVLPYTNVPIELPLAICGCIDKKHLLHPYRCTLLTTAKRSQQFPAKSTIVHPNIIFARSSLIQTLMLYNIATVGILTKLFMDNQWDIYNASRHIGVQYANNKTVMDTTLFVTGFIPCAD